MAGIARDQNQSFGRGGESSAPIWPLQHLDKWSDGSKTSGSRIPHTGLARAFHRLPAPPHTQGEPAESEPAVQSTRGPAHPRGGCDGQCRAHSDGCQRCGHPRPGNEAHDALVTSQTTGFGRLQSGTLVEGPTGRGGPAATCSASKPRTRGSFDLRCVLTETKTSRLVFAESRWLLFGALLSLAWVGRGRTPLCFVRFQVLMSGTDGEQVRRACGKAIGRLLGLRSRTVVEGVEFGRVP